MANAGERPKFLRWGHGEPPSEYLVAFSLPWGRKRAYSGSYASECVCWPTGSWQEWTSTPGSYNISYVNRFVRGLRLRRWLRFSSTVVRRIEIAVFVAKPGPVASDFEAISSPWERQFSSSSLQPAGGVRGSIPDIPVAGQQALQFIREAGYLTGDLPDLLGQNLLVSWLIKRYTLG